MTDFSAKASTLGTLHQVRYSLVLLLGNEEATLQLEGLDDIDMSAEGQPDRLLQLKHRAAGTVLTDLDPDLWKTLRIWSEHMDAGRIDPMRTVFALVTTASAATKSAPALLRPGPGRDVATALVQLQKASSGSENQGLKKAFNAFGKLDGSSQRLLLDRVFILDDSPSISASRTELEAKLGPTIRQGHREPLADRLEGWWFRQCVDLLRGRRSAITAFEVFDHAQLLAEQFRPGALPIDYFGVRPSAAEATEYSRRQFVDQLSVLGISAKRIENAVLDFHRAFVQRSRWATDLLLIGGEVEAYEARLREEWERTRDILVDEMGSTITEENLKSVGKEILKWAEQTADLRIRPEVTDAFVQRGSFHILADTSPPKVWWHPDFAERLSAVLGPGS